MGNIDLQVTAAGQIFTLSVNPALSLSQAIYTSGFFEAPPLCSALGHCGLCTVQFLVESSVIPQATGLEQTLLGAEKIAQHQRLSCRHKVQSGMQLALPEYVKILHTPKGCHQETGSKAAAQEAASKHASRAKCEPACGQKQIYSQNKGSSEQANVATRAHKLEASQIVALDMGSTSMQYQLLTTPNTSATPHVSSETSPAGATHAEPHGTPNSTHFLSRLNPQLGAGSDIMSRLAFAATPEGRNALQRLTLQALQRDIAVLLDVYTGQNSAEHHTERPRPAISELVLAANPAMTYLLLNLDPAGLASAPYKLCYSGGTTERIAGLPPLWVSPLISPFIGGDISAGFAALAMQGEVKYPFILADMGTNGEFILALDQHTAVAASVPLGPALEGIGMSFGTAAHAGSEYNALQSRVANAFELTPKGLQSISTHQPAGSTQPGTLKPEAFGTLCGISGSGYISLVHKLYSSGIINYEGRFNRPSAALHSAPSPLQSKLFSAIRPNPQGIKSFYITPDVYISATDIEEILKVKAAFSLALELLLKDSKLQLSDIAQLYIAGAMGRHVPLQAGVELGFIPKPLAERTTAVGNTALAGAVLLARQKDLRPDLVKWAKNVHTLDLAASTYFQSGYPKAMHFA